MVRKPRCTNHGMAGSGTRVETTDRTSGTILFLGKININNGLFRQYLAAPGINKPPATPLVPRRTRTPPECSVCRHSAPPSVAYAAPALLLSLCRPTVIRTALCAQREGRGAEGGGGWQTKKMKMCSAAAAESMLDTAAQTGCIQTA